MVALKRTLTTTLIVLYILSLPHLSGWHAEKSLKPWLNYQLPNDSTDVVVVLGGFMVPDPLFGYGVEAPFDRLLTGIRLLKSGRASILLLSGGVNEYENRDAEALYMKQFIDEFSPLPDSVLILEKKSTTTFENALFSKTEIEQRGLSMRIYLVSSASHLQRAQHEFEKNGFSVIPVPVDLPVTTKWAEQFPFYLIPSAHSLIYWGKVYREWMGTLFYAVIPR